MSTHVRSSPASADFKKWFDKASTTVLKLANHLVPVKEIMPMMVVFDDSGEHRIIMVPMFDTAMHKDFVAFLHRKLAAEPGVKGVLLIVEAWSLSQPTELKNYQPGSLAKHPDRVETLMLSAIKGTMQLMAMYEILGSFKTKDRRMGKRLHVFDANDPKAQMTGRFTVTGDHEHKLDS